MQTVKLDAHNWKTIRDFFGALRQAIGAPEWHGNSLDAFLDSMVWHDDINELKAPYVLEVIGLADAPSEVRSEVNLLAGLLRQHGDRNPNSDLFVDIRVGAAC